MYDIFLKNTVIRLKIEQQQLNVNIGLRRKWIASRYLNVRQCSEFLVTANLAEKPNLWDRYTTVKFDLKCGIVFEITYLEQM